MMRRQRGFTLVEVMASATATGVVILAANAFMMKALDWFDDLSAKIEINRHARETYDLMAYGAQSSSVGKDGTSNLYAIRGFNVAPPNGMRTPTNALQYTSNRLTIAPDSFATMTVTCMGVGTPVPDCKDNHSTQSVAGWIGSDVKLQAGPQAVSGLTVEVSFTVTDTAEAVRAKGPAQFSNNYYTIFTLNRDEADPH
jgi:prepilin-type N-terminal cleavage/methylation domain-containing protein